MTTPPYFHCSDWIQSMIQYKNMSIMPKKKERVVDILAFSNTDTRTDKADANHTNRSSVQKKENQEAAKNRFLYTS